MDGTIFRIILLQSTTTVIVEILAIAQLKNWLRIIRWEDMYHSRSKFKWIFNICIYIYTQTITDTYVYNIFIKFQFKRIGIRPLLLFFCIHLQLELHFFGSKMWQAKSAPGFKLTIIEAVWSSYTWNGHCRKKACWIWSWSYKWHKMCLL